MKKAINIHLEDEIKMKAKLKAVRAGTNLKNYIENLVVSDVSGEAIPETTGRAVQATVAAAPAPKRQVIVTGSGSY